MPAPAPGPVYAPVPDTLVLSSAAQTPVPVAIAPLPAPATPPAPPPDPNAYFMSQVYSPTYNPDGPTTSANCGPTSLAMAEKAFGRMPPGLGDPNDVERYIELTRLAMTGADDIGSDTTLAQLSQGAAAAGLQTAPIHSVADVLSALQSGSLAIVAGNQAAYNAGFSDAQLEHFGDGGHFILVTGFDGTNFTVDDPLSHVGAISVTPDQLAQFMAYQNWNSGLAVRP